MKKILTALLILAASAAFANTPGDPGVTLTGWTPESTIAAVAYDLDDNNGFQAYTDYGEGYGAYAIFSATSVDGWLFNPNDTMIIDINNDFVTPEILAESRVVDCFASVFVGDDEHYAEFSVEYNEPGIYALTVTENDGLNPGDVIKYASFYLGGHRADGDGTYALLMPSRRNISAKFYSSEQDEETVVPEPATAAYALLGLGSLIGVKRRIKK